MLLPHGTVIALVDGAHWKLWRNAGNEAAPELAALETPALVEHNHGSGGRHGSSSGGTSAQRMAVDAHAAAVADWLNRQVAAHKLEALVVVAAPAVLGELRHHYSAALRKVLVGELTRDLIGQPAPAVLQALRGH